MEYSILFMIGVLMIALRVYYVNALIDDWNICLAIYVGKLGVSRSPERKTITYLDKYKLEKWKYYHRIDVWSINKLIADPFLIQDVLASIRG